MSQSVNCNCSCYEQRVDSDESVNEYVKEVDALTKEVMPDPTVVSVVDYQRNHMRAVKQTYHSFSELPDSSIHSVQNFSFPSQSQYQNFVNQGNGAGDANCDFLISLQVDFCAFLLVQLGSQQLLSRSCQ